MDKVFEIYSKEELQLAKCREILNIYDEESLVWFISKEILNTGITFEFSRKQGFELSNKEFTERINDSGFTYLFKTAIKENYISPYKTGILKIEETSKELLSMYNEIESFRERLKKYRLKNKIETRNNFDFQKLISFVLKQVNKLEKYLLKNHFITSKDKNSPKETTHKNDQKTDDLNFIVFTKRPFFKEIEKTLIEKEYIDKELKWLKTSATFIRFFNLLISNGFIYFNTKRQRKDGLENLIKRYNHILSNKSKTPSRISKYANYHKEFSFLEVTTPQQKTETKPYKFS